MRAALLAVAFACACVGGCAFWRGLTGGAESGITGQPVPPPPPGDNTTLYGIGALLGGIGGGYIAGRYINKKNA